MIWRHHKVVEDDAQFWKVLLPKLMKHFKSLGIHSHLVYDYLKDNEGEEGLELDLSIGFQVTLQSTL